jgi:hypothetical protein
MILIRAISPKVLLLTWVALISVSNLSAEDRFVAMIQADPKTETTSVRIRIPKEANSQSIQSAYLQRKSATGLDIHIPINVTEDAEAYSIFMILPTPIADKATIAVTHNRAIEPNADGSLTTSSLVQGGESYEIALSQAKNKKSEQGAAGQPATRSESDSEGGDKSQPESEGRSR